MTTCRSLTADRNEQASLVDYRIQRGGTSSGAEGVPTALSVSRLRFLFAPRLEVRSDICIPEHLEDCCLLLSTAIWRANKSPRVGHAAVRMEHMYVLGYPTIVGKQGVVPIKLAKHKKGPN
ncbi:hypothetical protein Bbelb_059060 [Branchiostoma belcheri]|nr:hypothetical protein Bbelb_059060 [Branchiostoma belcheri]